MNRHQAGEVLLWLFVIWVGIQFGAGLYEKQIVVPQWSTVPPEEVGDALSRSGQENSALKFWAFVSPPVAVLALANAVVAWRTTGRRRNWWLAASIIMVIYSIFTYTYFVPKMIWLWQAETLPASEVESTVFWWVRLNYVRMIIGACGWLAALKALSLSNCGENKLETAT